MRSPIVLLHGALGSSSQLKPLSDLLSNHFEVHLLNFQGHGGRHSEKEFSIDLFAEDLRIYLMENQLEHIPVFGYSMGGYVALKLACERPELISSIITYGTKFDWNPETASKEVRMLDPNVIEAKVPRFAEQLKTLHGDEAWKEVLHKTGRMMIGLGTKNALSPEEFRSIQIPVLIGIGTADQMVSPEESRIVAQLLPKGVLETFDEQPHPLDKVDLTMINLAILSFLH